MQPKIRTISESIIEVEGSYAYQEGQFFTVRNKPSVKAYLLTASVDRAFLLVDTPEEKIVVGDELVEQPELKFVDSSMNFFGQVINVDADVVMPEKKRLLHEMKMQNDIFSEPANMMQRQELNTQLYTGWLGIDLLTPIGLGQRQLIIGDRKTGKTHIALNAIINQVGKGVKCIYVAIGQKREQIAFVHQILKRHNALSNTIIVEANAASAYQQFLAPYVAMAHAENFAKKDDVLIVFDDLTQHANVYRELSLLIDKPIGKEAFPGDVFYLHSRLLEKSGKFLNGKTITCLPIIKTVNNDLTGLIGSNIISITDGQIMTDSELYAHGNLPAVNFNLSVSRTGSSVQQKHISKIAAQVNKVYLGYKKQMRLANLDYDLNTETASLIYRGKEIEKILIQKGFGTYTNEFLLIMVKIISWGLLQHVKETDQAKSFISALIKYERNANQIFSDLSKGVDRNEKMVRSYFAARLNEYLKSIDSESRVPLEIEFIPLKSAELNEIKKRMEV